MSNETKIGILSVVTIALFIFGFKFIKGQNLLSSSNIIYVKYDQVDMMSVSSGVMINGLQVGVVTDIYLNPETMTDVIVVLDIESDVPIHQDAVAEIISESMMGGKAIRIVENKPCTDGSTCLQSGDYIKGRTLGLLEAMVPKGEISEYLATISENISPAYDSLNQSLRDTSAENLIGKTMQDLQLTMANLKQTTDQLNGLMAASSGSVKKTMSNLESISGNIKDNNERINNVLANAEGLTDKLNKVDIDGTVNSANKAMVSADEAIVQLKESLKKADQALAEFADVAKKINEGDGTMAMLINDPEFAQKLSTTVSDLDVLLSDFKDHPYNYMPLKSRRRVLKWREKDEKMESE